jgi:hypothetical protein
LLYGGWIGLGVVAVAAVLVLVWVLVRRIAGVVSGLLLLALLLFAAWLHGGWTNVAGIVVFAVAAALVFAWARSRNKRHALRLRHGRVVARSHLHHPARGEAD